MIENFIIITGLTFACHYLSEINACELLPKLYLCLGVNTGSYNYYGKYML